MQDEMGETGSGTQPKNADPGFPQAGNGAADKAIANLHPDLQKAFTAARANNLAGAELLLRGFLQEQPDDVNALKLLAEVKWTKGDLKAAEAYYARCVQLAPGFLVARHRYATLLLALSKFGPARAEIDALLRHDPNNLNYRSLMAYSLGQVGEYAEALAYHEGIVKEVTDQPGAWMVYANDLRAAGDRSACIAAYKKVIELNPAFAEAWWNLSNLKTFRWSQTEMDAMRDLLARSDLAPRDRTFLHFSLGKALEDNGNHEEALDNFKRGNALQRSSTDYDADRTTREFERLKAVFTPDFFDERSRVGCLANDPIFVVGLPRSGSTLVEQILSSHSAIEGTRELPNIQAIALSLAGRFPDSLYDVKMGAYAAMGERYLEETRIYRRLGRPFFIDKMPSNFAYAGWIHLILPSAKIIDVRRNPLDCCMANFKQIFSRAFRFSYSLTDLGRYYRDYVDLMAHFDQALPGTIHRISYEALIDRPEAEIARLLEYLDLPFEQGCLRFYENDRPVRTASSEQVRVPLFRESVGSWRNYASALEPLKVALGPALHVCCCEGGAT